MHFMQDSSFDVYCGLSYAVTYKSNWFSFLKLFSSIVENSEHDELTTVDTCGQEKNEFQIQETAERRDNNARRK